MKILGRGWQYTVYDMGKGRVLKKYNTLLSSYLVMLRESFRYIRMPVFRFNRYYIKSRETALLSVKIISESGLEKWMFGNPKIIDGCNYEQDKVVPLLEYFKHANLDDGKMIIDKFVEFNKLLLSNSLIEKNFNIKNFGINNSGNIMLFDLGEIYSNKEEVQRQIQMRMWVKPDIIDGVSCALREYFIDKMDSAFKIN